MFARDQYRDEIRNKINNSMSTDFETCSVYKSKWLWFEECEFLRDSSSKCNVELVVVESNMEEETEEAEQTQNRTNTQGFASENFDCETKDCP